MSGCRCQCSRRLTVRTGYLQYGHSVRRHEANTSVSCPWSIHNGVRFSAAQAVQAFHFESTHTGFRLSKFWKRFDRVPADVDAAPGWCILRETLERNDDDQASHPESAFTVSSSQWGTRDCDDHRVRRGDATCTPLRFPQILRIHSRYRAAAERCSAEQLECVIDQDRPVDARVPARLISKIIACS